MKSEILINLFVSRGNLSKSLLHAKGETHQKSIKKYFSPDLVKKMAISLQTSREEVFIHVLSNERKSFPVKFFEKACFKKAFRLYLC